MPDKLCLLNCIAQQEGDEDVEVIMKRWQQQGAEPAPPEGGQSAAAAPQGEPGPST